MSFWYQGARSTAYLGDHGSLSSRFLIYLLRPPRYMPPCACLPVLSCNLLLHFFTLSIRRFSPFGRLLFVCPSDSPLLSIPHRKPTLRPAKIRDSPCTKPADAAFHNLIHPIILRTPCCSMPKPWSRRTSAGRCSLAWLLRLPVDCAIRLGP